MGHDPSVGAENRGRSRAALIETATRLFSERGPGAVSAREIAREAGVNYALIHRHFGTKDGLLQAVLVDLSLGLNEDLALPRHGDRSAALLDDHEELWRILGYLCLENQEWVTEHVGSHPGFGALLGVVADGEPDREVAAIRSGVGAAMVMGWVILRPFIDKLAQLDGIDEAKIQTELHAAVKRALLPPGSSVDLDAVDLTDTGASAAS
ncbi:MAG: helix-turn-helix domain-containing protein [Acidimicrobiales bacterium]